MIWKEYATSSAVIVEPSDHFTLSRTVRVSVLYESDQSHLVASHGLGSLVGFASFCSASGSQISQEYPRCLANEASRYGLLLAGSVAPSGMPMLSTPEDFVFELDPVLLPHAASPAIARPPASSMVNVRLGRMHPHFCHAVHGGANRCRGALRPTGPGVPSGVAEWI